MKTGNLESKKPNKTQKDPSVDNQPIFVLEGGSVAESQDPKSQGCRFKHLSGHVLGGVATHSRLSLVRPEGVCG